MLEPELAAGGDAVSAHSLPVEPGRRPAGLGRKLGIALVISAALATLSLATLSRHGPEAAELSRKVIGHENTARVESWYFAVHDRFERLRYRIAGGGDEDPFPDAAPIAAAASMHPAPPEPEPYFPEYDPPAVIVPPKPAPLALPEVRPLRPAPQAGEGVWTTDGLPRTDPDLMLMAKTFVRPDTARPYATVGVLLLDKRYIRLHITGGTEDPGGDRGIKGPGTIPHEHRGSLLVAWNGGFRGPHGGFGMYADGKTYRPLRAGLASIVMLKDGSFRIGEWGRDLAWSEDIAAVRQNAVLLVDGCEVSKRTREDNNTWGYVQVNSAEFITWRSAIGVTAEGDLLVAAGNSLSAETLARALWAAGACYAMQLDINSPYVLTSLYFPQPDGSVTAAKFMESMPDNPNRFFSTQTRDFMYVTLREDETAVR